MPEQILSGRILLRRTQRRCRRAFRKLRRTSARRWRSQGARRTGRTSGSQAISVPIPVNGTEDAAAAADEYYQIAKTFAERGVTVLDFETFADIDGILRRSKKIRAGV